MEDNEAFYHRNSLDRDSRCRPDTCRRILVSTQLYNKALATDYTSLCKSEKKKSF